MKEMGTPDHLTCLLRNPYAGQEATVRTGHGATDWFQKEKEYVKAVYCHLAYLTSMQSTSWEMLGQLNWTETWSQATFSAFFFNWSIVNLSSIQFSHSVMPDSLWPCGLQHTRLPCPSPTPRACSNSCPCSRWCHPTISSSAVPFSSRLQSFLASESFPVSQFFVSGGQSIGVSASASALPMNIKGWFPLGWTGWISFQSKELSRVFSNTTVQKYHFFGA